MSPLLNVGFIWPHTCIQSITGISSSSLGLHQLVLFTTETY